MTHPDRLDPIAPDDDLYRRLGPDHVQDGKVVSNAYKRSGKPDPRASVAIARLTTPEEVLKDTPDAGLGVIKARIPIELGLVVRHDPVHELYAHALIVNEGDGRRQKEVCRLLADATVILKHPRPRE